MSSVVLHSTDETYNHQSFYNKFYEICNEHKAQNKALVFAFLLYDFETPHISSVLQNKAYWRSLDSLTNDHITVFSVHHKEKIRLRVSPSDNDRGVFRMVSISDYRNPIENTREIMKAYFSDVDIKFPAIMFFQVQNDNIIDYTLIQLDENEIEKSFLELTKYLKTVVTTLQKIEVQYKGNSKEIFELVKTSAEGERGRVAILNHVKKLGSITQLLRFVSNIGNNS